MLRPLQPRVLQRTAAKPTMRATPRSLVIAHSGPSPCSLAARLVPRPHSPNFRRRRREMTRDLAGPEGRGLGARRPEAQFPGSQGESQAWRSRKGRDLRRRLGTKEFSWANLTNTYRLLPKPRLCTVE